MTSQVKHITSPSLEPIDPDVENKGPEGAQKGSERVDVRHPSGRSLNRVVRIDWTVAMKLEAFQNQTKLKDIVATFQVESRTRCISFFLFFFSFFSFVFFFLTRPHELRGVRDGEKKGACRQIVATYGGRDMAGDGGQLPVPQRLLSSRWFSLSSLGHVRGHLLVQRAVPNRRSRHSQSAGGTESGQAAGPEAGGSCLERQALGEQFLVWRRRRLSLLEGVLRTIQRESERERRRGGVEGGRGSFACAVFG